MMRFFYKNGSETWLEPYDWANEMGREWGSIDNYPYRDPSTFNFFEGRKAAAKAASIDPWEDFHENLKKIDVQDLDSRTCTGYSQDHSTMIVVLDITHVMKVYAINTVNGKIIGMTDMYPFSLVGSRYSTDIVGVCEYAQQMTWM